MSKKPTKRQRNWNALVQYLVKPAKRYKHQRVTHGRDQAARKDMR